MGNFSFMCPFCKLKLACDDSFESQLVRCPACNQEIMPTRTGSEVEIKISQNDPENDFLKTEQARESQPPAPLSPDAYRIILTRNNNNDPRYAFFDLDFASGQVSVAGDDAELYLVPETTDSASSFRARTAGFAVEQNSSLIDLNICSLCNRNSLDTIISVIHQNGSIEIEELLQRLLEYKLANGGYVELNGGKRQGDCLRLFTDHITLNHTGILNFLSSMGVQGEKHIYFDKITAIQIKKPGAVLAGYIQFSILGEIGSKKGMFDAANDENTVIFYNNVDFFISTYIRDYIHKSTQSSKNNSQNHQVQSLAIADEIKKMKELLECGAISEDEFSSFKKKIMQ